MAVNFICTEKGINCPIACLNSDLFSKLEDKLYLEYPELRNKRIYFIANGDIINKASSLEQNRIKNGNQILINFE